MKKKAKEIVTWTKKFSIWLPNDFIKLSTCILRGHSDLNGFESFSKIMAIKILALGEVSDYKISEIAWNPILGLNGFYIMTSINLNMIDSS